MIRAGKLRHIVQVQERSTAKDALGGRVDTWTTVATVRASIEPLNAKEAFAGSGEYADLTHRVRLRFDPRFTLTASHRLVHNGVVFDVLGQPINTGLLSRELIVPCAQRSREN